MYLYPLNLVLLSGMNGLQSNFYLSELWVVFYSAKGKQNNQKTDKTKKNITEKKTKLIDQKKKKKTPVWFGFVIQSLKSIEPNQTSSNRTGPN